MTLVSTYSLIILVATLGAQKLLRPFLVGSRVALTVGLMGLATVLTYQTADLYSLWGSAGAPSAYLLPPYLSGYYFFYYAFTSIWANYLISLAIGLLVALGMKLINRKRNDALFYPEEYPLAILSLTLVGNPLWIISLVVLIGVLTIRTLLSTQRVSALSLWLPLAIVTLLASPFLRQALPLFLLRV